MRRSTHLFALAAGLALLTTLVAPGFGRVAAQDATPVATPVTLPATPVGDQLDWVLTQLNGGAATLTEAEIAAHFAPGFLAGFPVPLLDLLRETASGYAPVVVTGFPFPPTSTGVVATVDLATGEQGAVYLTVEPEPPHRITRLDLTEAPAEASATGRRVSIGDRALYLDCQGSGGPTVVLEGGITSDWAAVQPVVAEEIRVCSYDRPDAPGSRSDPTAERTAAEVVADLRALLIAANEPGPYLLVGHSMGGLYVQLFAYQHPDDVAGLVLIDPTPEEFSAGLAELLRSIGTPVPTPTGPLTIDETSFKQLRDARAAAALRPIPLIVLGHGIVPTAAERPPGWPVEAEEALFRRLHQGIADLVPGGQYLVVEGSGHSIHQERSEAVIAAIDRVVAAVQDPGSLATPTAATPAARLSA